VIPRRLRSALGIAASVAAVASSLGACGSGSSGDKGSVTVLYAGSLANLMEHRLGPVFSHAAGYGYQGFAAGSTELAAQIKSGVRRGDVFISASPAADGKLEGAANGNHVTWYVTFAKSPLVVGYNPHSSFAAQFRSKPWYEVITQPGIKVGRTDPKLDPKGKLTVRAMEQAATELHRRGLKTALSRFPVFPEEDLVGRLEAGQLDAGFFYSVEAASQHIPTVSIQPVDASATYTITILKGPTDSKGAQAFLGFFLGSRGRSILAHGGLSLVSPALTGPASGPPASVQRLLGG
jgi:molybdate/tungstate transport system substrate-binding protein